MSTEKEQLYAVYSIYIACGIQRHHHFPLILERLGDANFRNAFASLYPLLENVRREKCSTCPASMKYNHGFGIDCGVALKMPFSSTYFIRLLSNAMPKIQMILNGREQASYYIQSFQEIENQHHMVPELIQHGVLQVENGEEFYQKQTISVESNSSPNTISISPAALAGYILTPHRIMMYPAIELIMRSNKEEGNAVTNSLWLVFYTASQIRRPIRLLFVRESDLKSVVVSTRSTARTF